jgi:3-(3-hydroxy-phenyl)propionate hydroxylase
VHGATLRVLDRAVPGLGAELARRGIVWPTRRTLWRGRAVFERTYDAAPKKGLPHFTSLPQTEIEAVLLDACSARGVEIVWQAAVRAVTASENGLRVDVDEGRAWQTEYLIGADGARSAVREAIGVELEGSRSANSYVIVDVAEDPSHPLPIERVFHYEHPAVGARNVLLVPFAGGWRADLQCDENDDPEAFASPDGVRRWIAATLGASYAERVTWVSTYQFLQVVARTFVDATRRVLLVGEAAHLFAPFGARGMNSGVADADRAAEAVSAALAAKTRDEAKSAIHAFAAERHAAAVWNRAAAGEALAHLRAATLDRRLLRIVAALAAPFYERAGEWLDRAPYGPAGGPPGGKY